MPKAGLIVVVVVVVEKYLLILLLVLLKRLKNPEALLCSSLGSTFFAFNLTMEDVLVGRILWHRYVVRRAIVDVVVVVTGAEAIHAAPENKRPKKISSETR